MAAALVSQLRAYHKVKREEVHKYMEWLLLEVHKLRVFWLKKVGRKEGDSDMQNDYSSMKCEWERSAVIAQNKSSKVPNGSI